MRAKRWARPAFAVLLLLAGAGAMSAGCGGDDDDEPATTQAQPATTPNDTKPPPSRKKRLEKFIRLSYELAVAEADPASGQFTEEGKELLQDADMAWREYVEVRRPKTAIARMMVQAYGPNGLDKPADAAEAAEIVALAEPSAQAYIELLQHATRAGQTRKADLAGQKALELARPDERETVRALIEQAKLTPVQ